MNLARPRNVVRVALTALIVMLSLIGLSLPASAASSDAVGPGADAHASWDWVDSDSISITYRDIVDTACDSNDVYMNIRIYQVLNPDGTDVAGLRNNLGCNRGFGSIDVRRWDGSNNITGVRVRACVDDAGGDTCYSGTYQDNPYT